MIFYLFFRIAFVFVYMVCLLRLKYDTKKSFVFMISFNVFLWLVCYAIYIYKGSDFLDSIFVFIVTIPAYVSFLFVSKHGGFRLLFTFLTVCNFGMLKTYLGILTLYFTESLGLRLLSEFVCFFLTLFLLVKVFRTPYLMLLETLDKGWGLLCTIPITSAAAINLLLFYKVPDKYTLNYISIVFTIFILMFLYYIMLFLNFRNITQHYQMKETVKLTAIQTEMQKKEFDTIVDKMNSFQIYRHDIKHHINVINALIIDGNIAEVQNYLHKLNDNLDKTIIKTYCKNYVLNVILSSYISKAENEQIAVESKIDISENIKIDNMELGLIFTNAIENAITACKKIENPIDRKISIIFKEHYSQLYLQISNTYIEEVIFDGAVPVSVYEDHGFGTKSIVYITEKYKGTYSFSAKNGVFKLSVIL